MSDSERTTHGGANGAETHNGEAIRRLLQMAGPRPAAPAERQARVRAAVHAQWLAGTRRHPRRRVLLWGGWALAAAALVLVLSFAGWRPATLFAPGGRRIGRIARVDGVVPGRNGRTLLEGDAVTAGFEATTAADSRLAINLGDGISVRFDHDSRARIVSAHILELEAGALYVDSGVDAGAGGGAGDDAVIEVRTPRGIVRDVGTQFEVRLAPDDLSLSVREGRASLDRDGRSYGARAGLRLTVDASGAVTSGSVDPRGPEWDWVLASAPVFRIEGRPLTEYLRWVSRETGLTVRFDDPSIERDAATVVLHGSVEGLTPDQTPTAVLPTCGMGHRIEGELLVIERLAAPDTR